MPQLVSSNSDLLRMAGHGLAEGARVVWAFLNSSFGTSLVTAAAGAAAGAIAGAWVAQMVAGRAERRKAQTEEIRNTNAAINLAAGIVNSYVGVKRQFVIPMVADLKETGDRHAAWLADAKASVPQQPEPFEFTTEFHIFAPVQTPIDDLREILFNKVTSDNFTLSIYQLLSQAITNSQDTLAQRNAMVHEFRTAPPGATPQLIRLYLGLARPDGPVDERYPNLVNELRVQTNDVIMFGKELAQHLAEHGKAVAKQYGRGAPKAASVDFTRPERQGLVPDAAEYKILLAALRGEGPGADDEAAVRVEA
ncbi:MAG: hypothetical protein JWO83_3375 [Caulobacteraceae bacterium]|nr:hypothetical protein [Caulobacteraceae bacterium]